MPGAPEEFRSTKAAPAAEETSKRRRLMIEEVKAFEPEPVVPPAQSAVGPVGEAPASALSGLQSVGRQGMLALVSPCG